MENYSRVDEPVGTGDFGKKVKKVKMEKRNVPFSRELSLFTFKRFLK